MSVYKSVLYVALLLWNLLFLVKSIPYLIHCPQQLEQFLLCTVAHPLSSNKNIYSPPNINTTHFHGLHHCKKLVSMLWVDQTNMTDIVPDFKEFTVSSKNCSPTLVLQENPSHLQK